MRLRRSDGPAHLAAGRRAEAIAERFLIGKGLRLVTRNFRCRSGELDLVMEHDPYLVIVEIRYREHARPVSPLASISATKRQRIVCATRRFVQLHECYYEHPVRFDVVALSGPLAQVQLKWLAGAFDCSDWPGL